MHGRRLPRVFSFPVPCLFLSFVFLSCDGGTGPEDDLCALQSQISQEECQALAALFEATNGPAWEDATGWMVEPAPCSWFGVVCEDGAVIELDLNTNGLSGPIPPELTGLHRAQEIWLGFNDLSGFIPPELGNFPDLRYLYLMRNQLTGSIPPELGNLTSLRVLFLWGNDLTGPIPSELGEMSNLVSLELMKNRLSGEIPAALGELGAMYQLNLSENQLTGGIPAELGTLGPQQLLLLHTNQLSGVVPLSVAELGGRSEDTGGNCVFRQEGQEGNEGLYLPDTQQYRDADLDGDGLICEVGFGQG